MPQTEHSIRHLARVPDDHPRLARSPWRAHALTGAGAVAHDQGDYPAAAAYYDRSLALWRALGDDSRTFSRGIVPSVPGLAVHLI